MSLEIRVIATPGAPDGPCRGSCDHAKCHALRQLAEQRCGHCGVRFGFGTRITGEPALHYRCAQTIAARTGAPTHPINAPHAGHHPDPTTRGHGHSH